MSRVGKKPIELPAGVKTVIGQSGLVTVEGPKGKVEYTAANNVKVAVKDNRVVVEPINESSQAELDYGTTRSIINSMVLGVSKGWKRSLELNGVGFTATVANNVLTLAVGFSHDVKMPIPKCVTCKVNKNVIELESSNKQVVGEFAASIRRVYPPEPYLGKGIKYTDETIRRKAGKTGA